MKAYIVVEGFDDAKIIGELLPQEIRQQTTILPISASGIANLASVARTLLVTRRKPVAVLYDADTVDEYEVYNSRSELEELLRAVSGGTPFKVFPLVPDIEAFLCSNLAILESESAGESPINSNLPRRILQSGINKSAVMAQIVHGLKSEEITTIRETSPIKELIEFLSAKIEPKRLIA